MPHILTERIARRGLHLTREYSIDPFLDTRVQDIMSQPADTLPASMTIAEAVAFFTGSDDQIRHKSYPVIGEDGVPLGIVSRSDILRWSRDESDDQQVLAVAARADLIVGYADELVAQLADRMAIRDVGRVPIIERKSGRLVGLVARRDLLQVRTRVRTEEQQRDKLLRFLKTPNG